MRSMMQNTRYAIRQWRSAPAFVLTVIAVLALGLVLRRAVLPVSIGLAIGGAFAWFATRFAGSYIYGVGAHDTATFAAVTLVLAASSFLAAWLPARRAAAVDPILALRSE